jgi:two-component system sensor histidine kinase UhpB
MERVVSKVNNYIKGGIESWQDEYRFICADGSVKNVFDRGFILFDNEQKPYRMLGAMMDITERKKLQDELAAQSIARQRQVTEATIMAQEKERAQIGRELHDNINQILTTTKMYLDIALAEKDISEELMLKSHQNISSAIEEIRILSKSLVPPSLGDIGLKEAILEMIDNLKISQKINVRLRTSGFSKTLIPGNIQLMVFRIVQEQMSNVLKHSKATESEIKLTVLKNQLYVSISDNGIGFDPRKRMKGIGLMNITSRAEVHNGVVEIISSPGNGCTLEITIPL